MFPSDGRNDGHPGGPPGNSYWGATSSLGRATMVIRVLQPRGVCFVCHLDGHPNGHKDVPSGDLL